MIYVILQVYIGTSPQQGNAASTSIKTCTSTNSTNPEKRCDFSSFLSSCFFYDVEMIVFLNDLRKWSEVNSSSSSDEATVHPHTQGNYFLHYIYTKNTQDKTITNKNFYASKKHFIRSPRASLCLCLPCGQWLQWG